MKNNIVVEEGLAESIGGRKATLYRFNEGAFSVIGVDVRISHINIGLFDLGANLLAHGTTIPIKEGQSVETTISAMLRSIHKIIAGSKDSAGEIIGIGVGTGDAWRCLPPTRRSSAVSWRTTRH